MWLFFGNIVIDGNFWDHDYTISCDGKLFGTVSKEWLVCEGISLIGGDHYGTRKI